MTALPPPSRTVSAIVSDAMLRRAIRIERWKEQNVRQVLNFLRRELRGPLVERLSRTMEDIAENTRNQGFVAFGKIRKQRRYQAMLRDVDELIGAAYLRLNTTQKERLIEFIGIEMRWQKQLLEDAFDKGLGVKVNFNTPPLHRLQSAVISRPFQGKILREHYSTLSTATKTRVRSIVRTSIIEGDGARAVSARLRRALNTTANQAAAVARTAITHTANHAHQTLYEENADIVERVRWQATLDARTTDICASLDGQTFPRNSGPRPPAHYNCRSYVEPVINKNTSVLGPDVPQGERASQFGPVPGDTTFGQWLKTQPASFQNELLGKGRAEIFRRGKLPLSRFVEVGSLRPLRLEELRRLEQAI